jgi:hypothetical protein
MQSLECSERQLFQLPAKNEPFYHLATTNDTFYYNFKTYWISYDIMVQTYRE